MQRIPTDRLTVPDHVARWGVSARHHDRHLSAPSSTQYQYSPQHTVPHVRYQFPPGNRRSTGPPEIVSAVPQLLGPAVRQESPSEPGTGLRIRTYWHEDLQVRRAVTSSSPPGQSASPTKERKRDTLRKKVKSVIRVIKDLGNPSHKQDSGDKDRREKMRRSISSPV